jgi:uncharacterized protein YfcZ (UPF0381/DUF406 family)
MPRPTPIIIPGPSSMGGQSTNIDLGGVIPFIQGIVKERKTNKLAESLGIPEGTPRDVRDKLIEDELQRKTIATSLAKFLKPKEVPALEGQGPRFPLEGERQPSETALQQRTPQEASDILNVLSQAGTSGQQALTQILGFGPKEEKPKSLEGILAGQVNEGLLTVEQAKDKLQTLSPQQQAFRDLLSDEEKKQVLLKPQTQINIGKVNPVELAKLKTRVRSLKTLKTLFDEGGKDAVGPVEGRVNQQLFEKAGGQFMTPKEQKFYAAQAEFQNFMIQLITGAQMSESEAARIMNQIPGGKDKDTQWQAKWEVSLDNMQFLLDTIEKQSGAKAVSDLLSASKFDISLLKGRQEKTTENEVDDFINTGR